MVFSRCLKGFVGVDDTLHQVVSHHVLPGKPDDLHPFHTSEHINRHQKAGAPSGGRSIWEGSPLTTHRAFRPMRVRNIFICSGVVFCASIKDDKGVVQGAPAHEGEGGHFNGTPLHITLIGFQAPEFQTGRQTGASGKGPPSGPCRRAESPAFHQPPQQDG